MSISSVSSGVNSLQLLRAQSAFLKSKKSPEKIENYNQKIEEDVKLEISSKKINENQLISQKTEDIEIKTKQNKIMGEIKEFAIKNNLLACENEDLEYALKTGTSLYADYLA